MNLKKNNCFICNNINFNYLFTTRDYRFITSDKEFNIYECANCKLLKSYPDLDETDLSSYYPEINYYKDLNAKITSKIKYNSKFEKYLKKIRTINTDHDLKILDYGCGDMSLLKYFSGAGYDTFGFEINRSIEKIKDFFKFKNKIFFDLDTILKSNIKFDVIILNHVFEHLNDPISFIKFIKIITNKESLIILEVPNSNCMQIDIFKGFALHLDQPRHRYIYNKDNLETLFNNHDYHKIHSNDGFNKFLDYPLSFFKSFIRFVLFDNNKKFYKYFIILLTPLLFLIYLVKKDSHQSIGMIFSLDKYE